MVAWIYVAPFQIPKSALRHSQHVRTGGGNVASCVLVLCSHSSPAAEGRLLPVCSKRPLQPTPTTQHPHIDRRQCGWSVSPSSRQGWSGIWTANPLVIGRPHISLHRSPKSWLDVTVLADRMSTLKQPLIIHNYLDKILHTTQVHTKQQQLH